MSTEFNVVTPNGDLVLELVVDGTIRVKDTNQIAGTYKLLKDGGFKIQIHDEYRRLGEKRTTPKKNQD